MLINIEDIMFNTIKKYVQQPTFDLKSSTAGLNTYIILQGSENSLEIENDNINGWCDLGNKIQEWTDGKFFLQRYLYQYSTKKADEVKRNVITILKSSLEDYKQNRYVSSENESFYLIHATSNDVDSFVIKRLSGKNGALLEQFKTRDKSLIKLSQEEKEKIREINFNYSLKKFLDRFSNQEICRQVFGCYFVEDFDFSSRFLPSLAELKENYITYGKLAFESLTPYYIQALNHFQVVKFSKEALAYGYALGKSGEKKDENSYLTMSSFKRAFGYIFDKMGVYTQIDWNREEEIAYEVRAKIVQDELRIFLLAEENVYDKISQLTDDKFKYLMNIYNTNLVNRKEAERFVISLMKDFSNEEIKNIKNKLHLLFEGRISLTEMDKINIYDLLTAEHLINQKKDLLQDLAWIGNDPNFFDKLVEIKKLEMNYEQCLKNYKNRLDEIRIGQLKDFFRQENDPIILINQGIISRDELSGKAIESLHNELNNIEPNNIDSNIEMELKKSLDDLSYKIISFKNNSIDIDFNRFSILENFTKEDGSEEFVLYKSDYAFTNDTARILTEQKLVEGKMKYKIDGNIISCANDGDGYNISFEKHQIAKNKLNFVINSWIENDIQEQIIQRPKTIEMIITVCEKILEQKINNVMSGKNEIQFEDIVENIKTLLLKRNDAVLQRLKLLSQTYQTLIDLSFGF